MKIIAKPIFSIFSNLVSLLAAVYFVQGVEFTGDFWALGLAALIFTVLNYLVKPVLRLLLGPIIVLTLGLATILINALTLYLLDIFVASLTIQGYLPLVWATLIIAGFNWLIHFSAGHATD